MVKLIRPMLQTANILKCKSIIAVDRLKPRLELARSLGATHTIDSSDPEFTSLDEAVRQLVPLGASVAIETTGVPSIIEQSIQATSARGRIVLIGIPPLGYELSVNVTQHMNVRDYRSAKIHMSANKYFQYLERSCHTRMH